MGIRYEKDTILNWINEMGKFLRLLVDKWEGQLVDIEIEPAYFDFFNKSREELLKLDDEELMLFVKSLDPDQIRPLAQLMMYDGLINDDKLLLQKSKSLFEFYMKSTGSFSFEDFGSLAQIDKVLK